MQPGGRLSQQARKKLLVALIISAVLGFSLAIFLAGREMGAEEEGSGDVLQKTTGPHSMEHGPVC